MSFGYTVVTTKFANNITNIRSSRGHYLWFQTQLVQVSSLPPRCTSCAAIPNQHGATVYFSVEASKCNIILIQFPPWHHQWSQVRKSECHSHPHQRCGADRGSDHKKGFDLEQNKRFKIGLRKRTTSITCDHLPAIRKRFYIIWL